MSNLCSMLWTFQHIVDWELSLSFKDWLFFHSYIVTTQRYSIGGNRADNASLVLLNNRTSTAGAELPISTWDSSNAKVLPRLNGIHNGFMMRAEMCRDRVESILTDKHEVIERCKQHLDEHLSGAETARNENEINGGNVYLSPQYCRRRRWKLISSTIREVQDATLQV